MADYLGNKTLKKLCVLLEDLRGFPEGIAVGTAKQDIIEELKKRAGEL